MNAYEDLQRAIVTEWAAVTAITPEKIYFNRAPAGATLPYGIFYLSESTFHTNQGDMREFRVQFNLFSDSVSSEPINDFFDEVRTKFNRQKITMAGGHAMVGPMNADTSTIFQDEDDHWQATSFFDCKIK